MTQHYRNSVVCFLLGVWFAFCVSQDELCHNHQCAPITGAGSQCCNVYGLATCTLARSCLSACRNNTDCSQRTPTTKCQPTGFTCVPLNCSEDSGCPQRFRCNGSDCIPTPPGPKDSGHDEGTNPAVYAIPVVVFVVFCFCCQLRRGANRGANPPSPNPAPQGQTNQQNNSTNNSPPPAEDSTPRSEVGQVNVVLEPSTPDAIQESGPPAYNTLSLEEPEVPPPSYDEAVRQTSHTT